jgi:hypothetical protein
MGDRVLLATLYQNQAIALKEIGQTGSALLTKV